MNRMRRWTIAAIIAVAGTGGCHDDHAHDNAAAPGAAADAHAHDHDHSHGGEVRESLGLENAGPYEVVAVQLGKLKPGGQLAFDVEILGRPRPAAVRAWIGSPDADTSGKSVPESEKDDVYHVDVAVPQTVSPGMRLWVQIEPPQAEALVVSFPLK